MSKGCNLGITECIYLEFSGNDKGDDQLTKQAILEATTTTTIVVSTATTSTITAITTTTTSVASATKLGILNINI